MDVEVGVDLWLSKEVFNTERKSEPEGKSTEKVKESILQLQPHQRETAPLSLAQWTSDEATTEKCCKQSFR